jgi:chromosome segregation ATPase
MFVPSVPKIPVTNPLKRTFAQSLPQLQSSVEVIESDLKKIKTDLSTRLDDQHRDFSNNDRNLFEKVETLTDIITLLGTEAKELKSKVLLLETRLGLHLDIGESVSVQKIKELSMQVTRSDNILDMFLLQKRDYEQRLERMEHEVKRLAKINPDPDILVQATPPHEEIVFRVDGGVEKDGGVKIVI